MAENIGRNMLFVTIFLSTFMLIQLAIPSSFLIPPVNEDLILHGYPANKWYSSELGYMNQTYALFDDIVLGHGGPYDYSYLELGTTDIRATFFTSARGREIQLAREDTAWWLFKVHESLYIDGEFWIDLGTIEKYWVSGNLSRFTMQDALFTYHISISYNGTKFDNFEESMYGTATYTAEIYLFIGMTYEDSSKLAEYSANVFNLIGQILFFQNPYIHPVINTFIALPIWFSIAYITIRLVLWVVSAPLGGGG